MEKNGTVPQGKGEGITADFVWQYFKDVDTMNPDEVTKHYTENGVFRFANQPPVTGKAALTKELSTFYGSIQSMNHQNTGIWLGNHSAVMQADVHFVKKNGKSVILPAVSILILEGDKVSNFEFVMDASPIFSKD